MRVNIQTTYSQFDPQWSALLLGYNTASQYNIYNYGCLVSCLAMVARYFGKDMNPQSMNEILKQVTGFENGGVYKWGSITRAFGDITEKHVGTPAALTDDQINEIKSALDRALPVIIQIDYNPKTVAPDSHFVTVVDYDPNDENNFTIVDPLGGQVKSLKSYLGWLVPSARKTILEYFVYEGPISQPAVVPVPTPEPAQTVPAGSPGFVQVDIATNERLVKKSTQYDQVVQYLEMEKSPDDAMFEDVRRVIAGFKSRITDFQRQAQDAQKAEGIAEAQLEVLETQNGTLQADLTREQKAHKDEVDALKSSAQTPDNLKKTYDANLEAVKKERDDALETVRELRIEQANKKPVEGVSPTKPVQTEVGFTTDFKNGTNLLTRIIEFFIKLEP